MIQLFEGGASPPTADQVSIVTIFTLYLVDIMTNTTLQQYDVSKIQLNKEPRCAQRCRENFMAMFAVVSCGRGRSKYTFLNVTYS